MNPASDVKAAAVPTSFEMALHASHADSSSSRFNDLCLLVKPRLSSVVLLSTLTGFFLASPSSMDWVLLLNTLLGTALVAAGASMLNQVIERKSDAKMQRTRNRPLPAGRMDPAQALSLGAIAAIAGMTYLAASVNLEAALWATLTMALYVFVYTPLKRVTTLNTLVGAVPGAIPPLIGWTAAQGSLDARAWSLFAIIFVWQLPHFLAIAWMYREDYQRAGLLMLPTVDDGGHSTGRQVVLHSLSLIPVTLIPVFLKMAGGMYFVSALVLGVLFLAAGVNFASKRTDTAARVLFLASVAYLPLLLALMIVDKI